MFVLVDAAARRPLPVMLESMLRLLGFPGNIWGVLGGQILAKPFRLLISNYL